MLVVTMSVGHLVLVVANLKNGTLVLSQSLVSKVNFLKLRLKIVASREKTILVVAVNILVT